MEHYPFNTLGDSAYAVTGRDVENARIQRLTFGFPFIDVAPTPRGYDYLWAGYRPGPSTAGMNRGHVSVGTQLRDGTISRYKGHELVPTPHVYPSYGISHVGITRPEGVTESTILRDGETRPKGSNTDERETPFFSQKRREDVLPDVSLMKPNAPSSVIFPGIRGGASARTMERYHTSPFSMKWGEYIKGPITGDDS